MTDNRPHTKILTVPMNTRVQGALLEELYSLIPNNSQLWLATHSIGMMRKARELYSEQPERVVFLDFGSPNFDEPVILKPTSPTRKFCEGVLSVGLDDLASLVAPREVIICEGNPAGPVPGKNAEHDARCYEIIFGDAFPDVKFLSAGSSTEVAGDRLAFAAALPKIARGIKTRRLIDRDDHAPPEIADYHRQGIDVLSRRHLECYLYDDEVLEALCDLKGQPAVLPDLLSDKDAAIKASHSRGNAADDIKSAAPDIYRAAKQRLTLTGVGNDQRAFARNVLAPLVTPDLKVYEELCRVVFPQRAS